MQRKLSSRNPNRNRILHATVSGSFSKSLKNIQEMAVQLQKAGIVVRSPRISQPKRSRRGFVFLECDKGTAKQIEEQHLRAISRSDFLYLVNPHGYIGASVTFEAGFATSQGIPVFSSRPPSDFMLAEFIKPLRDVRKIARAVNGVDRRPSWKNAANRPSTSLRDIQEDVKHMVTNKGFDRETLEDKLILLTEEVGELAGVVRALSGVKTREIRPDIQYALSTELADCLIYLADIANLTGHDLEGAVQRKLSHNLRRTWSRVRL